MTADVQVRCINKTNRQSPHERISHIGGINPNGGSWKLTLDEAIKGIKQGKWSFFTMVGGIRANVVIATNNGREYLKTDRDSTTKDNLLSLPECS